MAIEKLTNTPTNIESLQKLNEVIDYSNLNINYLYVGDEESIDDSLVHDNLIVVDPDDLLEDPYLMTQMVGSSDTETGRAGTVPAPEAGSNNRFLAADATWKEIDVPNVDLSNVAKLNEENVFTKGFVIKKDPEDDSTALGIENGSVTIFSDSKLVEGNYIYDRTTTFYQYGVAFIDGTLQVSTLISPGLNKDWEKGILLFSSDADENNAVKLDINNKTINVTSDKAIADSNGDDISTTYLKKSDASTQYATINNPTFTGTVTVPKIVTTTGIEIY